MAQTDNQNCSVNENSNENNPQQPQSSNTMTSSLMNGGDIQSDSYTPISPTSVKKLPIGGKKPKSNDLERFAITLKS